MTCKGITRHTCHLVVIKKSKKEMNEEAEVYPGVRINSQIQKSDTRSSHEPGNNQTILKVIERVRRLKSSLN